MGCNFIAVNEFPTLPEKKNSNRKTWGISRFQGLTGPLMLKVNSIISNGTWKWPRSSIKITEVISTNTPDTFWPRIEMEDEVL